MVNMLTRTYDLTKNELLLRKLGVASMAPQDLFKHFRKVVTPVP